MKTITTLVFLFSLFFGNVSSIQAQASTDEDFAPNLLKSGAITPKNLYVYPTPAKEILYIVNTSGKDLLSVTVVDLYGRLIINENGDKKQINISQLKKGIYVAELRVEDIFYQYKFIKD